MTPNGKVGVVIEYFQVQDLSPDNIHMLDSISKQCETLCVMLRTIDAVPTDKHPLSFIDRKEMVLALYPNARVIKIRNCKSDKVWSRWVDATLQQEFGECEITIYNSVPSYSGRYKTYEVPTMDSTPGKSVVPVHAVTDRSSYRAGVIASAVNRFAIVYSAVDCALYKKENGVYYILLGHKEGDDDKHRFIGGITDVTDPSFKFTSNREAKEEAGEELIHEEPEYLDSFAVKDFRYAGTKDGVMTTFFAMKYISGMPTAHDDIDKVTWFRLDEAERIIVEGHKPLLARLTDFLTESKWKKVVRLTKQIFQTIFS